MRSRQYLNKVIMFELTGDKNLSLKFSFCQEALDNLASSSLGRIVLITDRHDWSTDEIIRAYRSQSDVEAAFSDLKDHHHLSIRPQYHWTDQKIEVHVFTCIMGLLLARLLYIRVHEAGATHDSVQSLCRSLTQVRRVRIVEPASGKRSLRLTTKMEDVDPDIEKLLDALKIKV